MKKRSFEVYSPVEIYKIKDFKKIKNNLINLINSDTGTSERINDRDVFIHKNDYHICQNPNRGWVQYFIPYFTETCSNFTKNMNFSGFEITAIWYQEYEISGSHGWHHHGGCNYSGVFYLENKDGICDTEFLDIKNKKIVNFDIKEGEVCFFPSYMLHRSPKNNYNSKKTIISFNLDFLLLDNDFKNISKKFK